MTRLGLPVEDFRLVTVLLNLPTAERWLDAANRDGFGDDLSGWLRQLAEQRAAALIG